jgi:hypothetical protein
MSLSLLSVLLCLSVGIAQQMLVPDKRLAVRASQQLEQSERENVGRRKCPASSPALDEIMVLRMTGELLVWVR